MSDDVPHKVDNIHLAIIPDGNRRWAKKKKKPVWYGHIAGAKKMEEFLDWCLEHPEIKMVSIYALSTENLNRSEKELQKLWDIYKKEFKKLLKSKKVKNNEIRINIVGDVDVWRRDVKKLARTLMRVTENYTRYILNILLAYGSHFEIFNAVKKVIGKGIRSTPLLRQSFSRFLMVNRPVDLVIRTGGQYRLSNFLLFQAAYAEIYFSKTLWPDFSREEFEKILRWFKKQKRKFGV
jgi:undecaprenyl diphosphate synthase